MIKRLYIHNFRCLENFELVLGDKRSALLIGKNGSGKSSIGLVLGLLQRIGRGTNRVAQLVKPIDFANRRSGTPMRLELEVELDDHLFHFALVLEWSEHLKDPRVLHEALFVDGGQIYARGESALSVAKDSKSTEISISIDQHLVALPIIQERSEHDPLFIFKTWLARTIILSPLPSLIAGESSNETLEPERDGRNLGAWFAGLVAHSPAAYRTIESYLGEVLPDFEQIKNPIVGAEARSLSVQFRSDDARLALPLAMLSDGEKCFVLAALALAANEAYGPVFCFWDEPDSHLSIDEVGHFIIALRSAFERGGQVLMTSHNAEAIRRFSDDTTFVLYRRSHLEPTRVKSLAEIGHTDDLVGSLLLGDLQP